GQENRPGVRHTGARHARHSASGRRRCRLLVLQSRLPRPLRRGVGELMGHHGPDDLARRLDGAGYLVDEGLATALHLAAELRLPLLLEGEPGVGKTAAAKALAAALDTPLIRLQCYEGLTVSEALYEWNYQRQL